MTSVRVLVVGKILISHGAHNCVRSDAFVPEDFAQGAAPVARLTQQRKGLETLMTHSPSGMQGAEAQIRLALVSHKDERRRRPADDKQRLFEPGIEPGEISQIGEMLAVTINDGMCDF